MKTESSAVIVLDTNILVSAALFQRSTSATVLIEAVRYFQVVQSEETWAEFMDVIHRPKFHRYLTPDERQSFIQTLIQVTRFVEVHSSVTDCSDPKDNKFLALALDAGAEQIISGDSDLLELNPYQGVKILTSSEFLVAMAGRPQGS